MSVYEGLKAELLEINQKVTGLLARINAMPGTSRHSFSSWEHICQCIEHQLSEEVLRVAVIGAIKSGKSTLINSLFSGDYLKRGAGVVTSMVTRTRRGEKLAARLFFKSWDEVNADIESALVLFPTLEWRSCKDPFDIRRESDRRELAQALASLESKHLLSNDTRNLNSLYLSSYLNGYDRVKAFLPSDHLTQDFTGADFPAHREFSGNDTLAFYLKDISLEINSGDIGKNIEIADCQGSDSPNPLHMAMIQDYLLLANLLIYVISSRTGIRQADINFLSMIKKMGILDSVVFVINCDLSEHESLDELQNLVGKITDDLAIIKPGPQVYAYSALLSLFTTCRDALPHKDQQRLLQWEAEKNITGFLSAQEKKFINDFQRIVTSSRYSLLLSNHSERLKMIILGLSHWLRVNQEVLTRDADGAARLVKKIKSQQKKIDRVKSMVKSTLDGAVQQIKRELRADVDHFFDSRYGEVVPGLIDFVKSDTIVISQYQDRLPEEGFSSTLYLVFQEFRHHIDTFMAENVNPRIFHFVRDEEEKIKEYFDSITGPYAGMVSDALAHYNTILEQSGACDPSASQKPLVQPDITILKRENKIDLPPAAATMNYSTAIKTEAVMRLGYYNFIKAVKRLFRQPVGGQTENAVSALRDSVARMKKETVESLLFHFKNYRENIKFQYVFRLVDIMSDHIFDLLMERFHDYSEDLSQLTAAASGKQVDKEQLFLAFQEAARDAGEISSQMGRLGDMLENAAQSGFSMELAGNSA
ncbi:MAG: dynamin family protein [Desulfobacteraceae bacterium]|nr:dynamin family protein [Desulfobacteraceae bacterium]